jgi:hypothetical protein
VIDILSAKSFSPVAYGDRVITVRPGDNLQTSYDYLKSASRDAAWGAASATNRRVLLLAPGTYTLTAALAVDAEHCDISALIPQMPGGENIAGVPCAETYWPLTMITSVGGGHPTVVQTAQSCRMHGFCIQNTGSTYGAGATGFTGSDSALLVHADNQLSLYTSMRFDQPNYGGGTDGTWQMDPVAADGDLYGTWIDCAANAHAWRVAANKVLYGLFHRCVGANGSFGGDSPGASIAGTFYDCINYGSFGFGGCSIGGIPSTAAALFVRCVNTQNSGFSAGRAAAGTYRWCENRGLHGFAGTPDATFGLAGVFTGVADYCVSGGGRAFGAGGVNGTYAYVRNNGITGTLRNCILTGQTSPIRVGTGAVIENCIVRIAAASTNTDCIQLLGNATMHNNILVPTGTGLAISATSYLKEECFANGGNLRTSFVSGASGIKTLPINLTVGSVHFFWKESTIEKTCVDDGDGTMSGDCDAATSTIDNAAGTFVLNLPAGHTADNDTYARVQFTVDAVLNATGNKCRSAAGAIGTTITLTNSAVVGAGGNLFDADMT